MNGFLKDVADASLPVAIILLIGALVALAAVPARPDDARVQRLAALYLLPLCTWCLSALGLYTFAVVAGGDAGVLSLAIPLALALGVAAILLWSDADKEADVPPAEAPVKPPVATAQTAAAPTPVPPAPGALWARPANELGVRRSA
jgi:peptidoglycan/LPS O-acetylase OafA/YrhL